MVSPAGTSSEDSKLSGAEECPLCGGSVQLGSYKCKFCGNVLKSSKAVKDQPKPVEEPQEKYASAMFGVAGLAIIAMVGWVIPTGALNSPWIKLLEVIAVSSILMALLAAMDAESVGLTVPKFRARARPFQWFMLFLFTWPISILFWFRLRAQAGYPNKTMIALAVSAAFILATCGTGYLNYKKHLALWPSENAAQQEMTLPEFRINQ